MVLITLWIRVGFNMIIYLAGLQAVPTELYEAAQTEGAGGWQRFRNITLPLLGPSSFFLLIMNVIYSFQVFDTIYVLTNGGPGSATEVLGTYAYKTAFGAGPGPGLRRRARRGDLPAHAGVHHPAVAEQPDPGRGGLTGGDGSGSRRRSTAPATTAQAAAPRRRRRGGLGLAVRIVLAVIVGIVMVFPFWVMLVTAFSGQSVFTGEIDLWPDTLSVANFTRVFGSWPVLLWFQNSVTGVADHHVPDCRDQRAGRLRLRQAALPGAEPAVPGAALDDDDPDPGDPGLPVPDRRLARAAGHRSGR